MKTAHLLTTSTTALLTMMGTASAASSAREDNSDFVVWAFLAFCAMIVIGQMVPMIRNLKAHKPAPQVKEVKEKV